MRSTVASPTLLRRSCSLLAGVLLMLGVGSTYALSAWNAQLKTLLHFTQGGISTISSMTMLGTYMSYFPGVIFDRLGPYTSVLLSGSAMLVIHLAMFTALQFAPESLSPLGMGSAMLLFGLLSSFCVFSSIVPNESLLGTKTAARSWQRSRRRTAVEAPSSRLCSTRVSTAATYPATSSSWGTTS